MRTAIAIVRARMPAVFAHPLTIGAVGALSIGSLAAHTVIDIGSTDVVGHHHPGIFADRPFPGRFEELGPDDAQLGQARMGGTARTGGGSIDAIAILPDKTGAPSD